jgi:hypothetical protein
MRLMPSQNGQILSIPTIAAINNKPQDQRQMGAEVAVGSSDSTAIGVVPEEAAHLDTACVLQANDIGGTNDPGSIQHYNKAAPLPFGRTRCAWADWAATSAENLTGLWMAG